MYQQQLLLFNNMDLDKINIPTQLGPWKSQILPIEYAYSHSKHKNKIYKERYMEKNKILHEIQSAKFQCPKIKENQQECEQSREIESLKTKYKEKFDGTEQKYQQNLQKYENKNLEKSELQKYMLNPENQLDKSKIPNKLKQKMNTIDFLSSTPSNMSLRKKKELILHKAQPKQIKNNYQRYNENILSLSNKSKKYKIKGKQKDLQTSLLPSLKSNSSKLLNLDLQNEMHCLVKGKSSKSINFREFNIMKVRNSVAKSKNIIHQQLKKQKLRLSPTQISLM